MIKTVRELVVDLERDRTEATLRNVLADLKESPNDVLRVNAGDQERALNAPVVAGGESMARRVERITAIILRLMEGFQYDRGGRRKSRRRGGAMIKSVQEIRDELEAPEIDRATLENAITDLKESDHRIIASLAEGFEENLREPLQPGEDMDARVRDIKRRLYEALRMFGRGRRRKTARRR